MSTTFSYGRKERLKKRKQITELFEKNQSFLFFPIKVFYKKPSQPLDFLIKTGVGANSRNFKKAVHRNRIKRLLREAYRLHKLPLHQYLEQHNQQAIVFFLYIDKALPQKKVLQNKMPSLIRELVKRLNETPPDHT